MAIIWTQDRIANLTTPELDNLCKNAIRANKIEVIEWCEAELEKRTPLTKKYKILQEDAVDSIVKLANKLMEIYDFDTEKARSLSEGSKHFIPHRLLDEKGSAKVGGAKMRGKVVFHRYISYRLKNEVYSLVAILFESEPDTQLKYQVIGPSRLLDNFSPIADIRPYLDVNEKVGFFEGGEEFDNFEEAANRFSWLIEQVAPKLNK